MRLENVCIIGLLAVTVAGCSSAAPPVPATGVTEVTPQQGGTLLLTTRQPAQTLLLWAAGAGLGTNITVGPMYQTLVSLDFKPGEDYRNHYRVIPWLAERWAKTDDRTYLFHLRRGVKWHDGKELSAGDVAWSYEYLRDPANRFALAASLASADMIEAVDGYTLRITTKGPAPNFLRDLAGEGGGSEPSIFARQVIEQGKSFDKTAIGTGPFKLESWDPQSGATLVRNPDYWQPDRPFLDRIKLVYGVDAAASLAAFRARQNDVVKFSDKIQFDSLQAVMPDVVHHTFPQQMSDELYLRVDRPPFNDPRVRRAMHLALDRQAMIDTITFGVGTVSPPGINGARSGWAIPQEELLKLPGYRQPKEQDRAEAKRLLAEAGYPNGLRSTVKYSSTHTRYPAEAQFVAEQMRTAGIQLDLQPQEDAVSRRTRLDGAFDTTFGSSAFLPEQDWNNSFLSRGTLNPGIRDQDLDRLIESYSVEGDEAKQKQLAVQVQRLLLDKLYVIPTITQVGFLAWQPYVHDWIDNRAGQAVNKGWSGTWVEVERLPAGRG